MHHQKASTDSTSNNLSTTPPTTNPFGLYLHTSTRPGGSEYSTSPFSSATTSPTSSPPTSPFRRALCHRNLSRSPDGHDRSQSPPLGLPAALRRSSLVLLRRRPSAVEVALSEERSRCDEDSIERQGLNLMEPRPIEPVSIIPMDLDASVFPKDRRGSFQSMTHIVQPGQGRCLLNQQPRFVMGGIDEVMEGSV